MPPPEVVMRAEPPKYKVEVIAEIVAGTQNEETHEGTEMNGLGPIVLIDDECVDKSAHCTPHSERTEEDGPHEFGEHVSEAREDDDADDQHCHLEDEAVKPKEKEWPDIQSTTFGGLGFFLVRCDEDLVVVLR